MSCTVNDYLGAWAAFISIWAFGALLAYSAAALIYWDIAWITSIGGWSKEDRFYLLVMQPFCFLLGAGISAIPYNVAKDVASKRGGGE